MRKTKLVWGIVLAAIGLLALPGVNTTDTNKVVYIILCVVFMCVGALLIRFYIADSKKYKQALIAKEEKQAKEAHLEESRKELEQAKIDAELQQIRNNTECTKVCPACGATTKGTICKYCGSKL